MRAYDARVILSPLTGLIEIDPGVTIDYQKYDDLSDIELRLSKRRKGDLIATIHPMGFNGKNIAFDVVQTGIAKDLSCGITYGRLYVNGCYVSTVEILKEIGWSVTDAKSVDLCKGDNGFTWDCCDAPPCKCESDDCPIIFCNCCGDPNCLGEIKKWPSAKKASENVEPIELPKFEAIQSQVDVIDDLQKALTDEKAMTKSLAAQLTSVKETVIVVKDSTPRRKKYEYPIAENLDDKFRRRTWSS